MAATGHRPDKLNNEWSMRGPMSTWIQENMELVCYLWNVDEGLSGMALGWDMHWALVLIRLGIPLTCAVPFKGQEVRWPRDSQKMYNDILAKATNIVYVCEPGYAAWKMQKRNVWMVTESDALLAGWDGSEGGTFNCYRFAAEEGDREIIRINPKDFKL